MIPSQDAVRAHDHEEVDMEIDMMGGVDIGRVDIPIKREPSGGTSTKMTNMSMENSVDLLIPPGFEEVYMSRIQCLASNI